MLKECQKKLFNDIYYSGIDIADTISNVNFLIKIGNVLSPVLEIGCGKGYVLNYLQQKDIEAIGLEISDEPLNYAKNNYPDVKILLYDGETLPFLNESYRTVISFDVLEHFESVDNHLSEVNRVLKLKGIYAFQTPNILTNLPKEIIFRGGLKKAKEFHPSVQSYYSLTKKLDKNGFNYWFVKMPIVSPEKLQILKTRGIGWKIAVNMLASIPENLVPIPLRPNFWVVATKVREIHKNE